jgi:hypothetical protein
MMSGGRFGNKKFDVNPEFNKSDNSDTLYVDCIGVDIKKYKFSDPNYDDCEIDGDELWIYVSKHNDLDQPTSITFTKDDVIAMAQHYKVTEYDLSC